MDRPVASAHFTKNEKTGQDDSPITAPLTGMVTDRIVDDRQLRRIRNMAVQDIAAAEDERSRAVLDAERRLVTNTNRNEWSTFLTCPPNDPLLADGRRFSLLPKEEQDRLCKAARVRMHGTSENYYKPYGGVF